MVMEDLSVSRADLSHKVSHRNTASIMMKPFLRLLGFLQFALSLPFQWKEVWLVHQMDVVTAFLNGDLKEEIYMQQPPGYVRLGKEDLVCKLKKITLWAEAITTVLE